MDEENTHATTIRDLAPVYGSGRSLGVDASTLASLETALVTSPNNLDLLVVVCEAKLEQGDAQGALLHIDRADLGRLERQEHRLVMGRVLLECGQFERGIEIASCPTPSPELLVLEARLLDALDRSAEAKARYQRGVAANPTLQDVALESRLGATPALPRGTGPRLRVIANDDTSESDAAHVLAPAAPLVKFDDVGGLSEVKREVERRIISPFRKPSLFQRFKKRIGGGVLMYGPPGCGKTLLARATAGECGAAFLNVAISDVLDMYIGESERKLAAVFAKARASTPAVLFFDELEALAGKRQFSRESSSAKLVSSFLSEMDGFAKNNQGVLVLGATNTPWAVDPAFRRPGRFDRVLFVPPPDRDARLQILRLQLAERPVADLKLERIADRTSGFSGADLENLVETASDLAIEASLELNAEQPIVQQHLEGALKIVRPTTLEWLTTARNYARYANEGGQYDDVLAFISKHGK